MFTRCSKCETVFKLSAEVLRAAGGQVRCGKCGEIFNALAHLAEDASAFSPDESQFELESRADRILQNPAPITPSRPTRSDEIAPTGVEIARLQILDWGEDELPAPESGSASGGEGERNTSMEFTLPPGELDRIFVEKRARAPVPPASSTPKAPSTVNRAAAAVSSVAAASAPQLPPHPEDIERLNALGRPPAASGLEVSEDVRREMLAGMQAEQPVDFELPAKVGRHIRRRSRPIAQTPRLTGRTHALWLGAAIALGALLLIQLVHQNREFLSAHAPLGGLLRGLYTSLGAPVSSVANLSAYQLRQWGVTGDPAADGTLRVRASILNTAAQLEPYPLLRVTLANRFGGSIGTRDFEPSEYLGRPTAKLLAPGERVDATMDILDPGKSAEGFEIDVCLRGADRRVACANEAALVQAKR